MMGQSTPLAPSNFHRKYWEKTWICYFMFTSSYIDHVTTTRLQTYNMNITSFVVHFKIGRTHLY